MKRLIIVGLALMTSGCAQYPDLVSIPIADGDDVQQILTRAQELQATYSSGYKDSAQAQDWSQLPLIGAAAAAAWVLLDNGKHAAKDAGKIGIGAGIYGAARGQLVAPNMADHYIAGYGALTCVIAEGSNFTGKGATRHSDFEGNVGILEQQIGGTLSMMGEMPAEPPAVSAKASKATIEAHNKAVEQGKEALKTAKALAETAVAQARTAYAGARKQLDAYDNAAPTFRNAVSSISVRVASKGRVRPAIDFATLRDSFAPPKTDAAALAEASERQAVELAGDINRQALMLGNAAAILAASTPRYDESLKRVVACPDQIK